jgi:hypothetical protein
MASEGAAVSVMTSSGEAKPTSSSRAAFIAYA